MKPQLLELPRGERDSGIFSLDILQCPLIASGPHASLSFLVDSLVSTL